ncbi:MAG TPA: nuclear transport factor 2 family protein [Acidiferrobacterales bacterium]|jgi:uncharacterized protein (TIGR02246 family)
MGATRFDTPEQAEQAFYRAFEQADVEAMMAVWAEDDDVTCIHPTGPRLQGPAAVRDSWRAIFRHTPTMRVDIGERRSFNDGELAVHIVHEHIGGEAPDRPPMIATNVYRREAGGWRMILHHASPGPKTRRPAGSALH